MHQKKIAKLKHKVFYKDKPRISNSSDNSKSQRPNILSIPSITKRFDNTSNNSRFGGGSKKTLSLHHNFSKLSYSIPLLSSLALLVVGLMATNPFGTVDKTSAVGNVIDVDYQRVMRSTATLTITPAASGGHGATNGVATEIIPGSVGYRAHDVLASVSDSTSYMLNLSYTENEENLHLVDGLITFEDVDKNGVEGSANIGEDQWGFAWGSKTADDASMTYYQVPQYHTAGTGIKNGVLEFNTTGTDRTATIDKKLVFAANFSPYTISGHYVASVLLSLAATPNDVSRLSELTDLQGMSPQICKNTPVGEINLRPVIDLRDENRNEDDYKGYNVVKLANGDCWMQENLSLDLNGKTLTPADSNVTEEWVSDTGASTTWGDIGNTAKFFNGTGGSNYNPTYGYYYSFGAVTAGTSKDFTSDSSQQVTQDICPKGWRLPTGDDFKALIQKKDANGGYIDKQYNGAWNNTSKAFVMNTTMGNLSFLAAGYVNGNALSVADSYGLYWSSTTNNSSRAYSFLFYNTYTNPENSNLRYSGLSVRCMAKRQGEM